MSRRPANRAGESVIYVEDACCLGYPTRIGAGIDNACRQWAERRGLEPTLGYRARANAARALWLVKKDTKAKEEKPKAPTLSKEQRSELAKARWAKIPKEDRSRRAIKGWDTRTPEQIEAYKMGKTRYATDDDRRAAKNLRQKKWRAEYKAKHGKYPSPKSTPELREKRRQDHKRWIESRTPEQLAAYKQKCKESKANYNKRTK